MPNGGCRGTPSGLGTWVPDAVVAHVGPGARVVRFVPLGTIRVVLSSLRPAVGEGASNRRTCHKAAYGWAPAPTIAVPVSVPPMMPTMAAVMPPLNLHQIGVVFGCSTRRYHRRCLHRRCLRGSNRDRQSQHGGRAAPFIRVITSLHALCSLLHSINGNARAAVPLQRHSVRMCTSVLAAVAGGG